MNGEFDGPSTYVMEPIRAVRSFYPPAEEGTYLGEVFGTERLRSITAEYTWQAGENVASCAIDPDRPHSMDDCSCGFYGFFAGSNDYHHLGRVSAVVEGYGEIILGPRGIRAHKARIIALCCEQMPRHRGLRGWLKDSDAAAIAATVGVLLLVAGVVLVSSLSGAWRWLWLLPWAAGYYVASAATGALKDNLERHRYLTDGQLASIRENYPDVPIFDSFDEMVEAFPPDTAEDILNSLSEGK